MAVEISPVESKAELERFIRVPMRLSKGDPNYVAPLMFERREALSKKVNPLFQHADAQFWLARKNGRDVGRISAQIDHLAKTDPDAPDGYFGMIAAEDDAEVFTALFRTAEAWLRERGRAEAIGPFNLSINEEVGLTLERDYVRRALGAHDTVAAAVAGRTVTAGGLSLPILQRLLGEGRVARGAVRILAESRPIPEYLWTFRSGLSVDLRESIRQAFIGLRDPVALRAYRAEAFIPAGDADVDRVRHWMEHLLQARLDPRSLGRYTGDALVTPLHGGTAGAGRPRRAAARATP